MQVAVSGTRSRQPRAGRGLQGVPCEVGLAALQRPLGSSRHSCAAAVAPTLPFTGSGAPGQGCRGPQAAPTVPGVNRLQGTALSSPLRLSTCPRAYRPGLTRGYLPPPGKGLAREAHQPG